MVFRFDIHNIYSAVPHWSVRTLIYETFICHLRGVGGNYHNLKIKS